MADRTSVQNKRTTSAEKEEKLKEMQTTLSTTLADKDKVEKELANCKIAFESLTQKIIRLSTIANSAELVTLEGIELVPLYKTVWISQLKNEEIPLD